MNPKLKFFPVLFSLFFTLWLVSCKTVLAPSVKGIEGYKVNNMNPSDMELQVNLLVNNPNDFKIILADYNLDISLNGLPIGKANGKDNITFDAKAEKAYPFILHTNLKAVLAQILPGLSLFSGGKQMELKVDGYIRAKAFGFGKKVPIHVNRNIDPGKLIKN